MSRHAVTRVVTRDFLRFEKMDFYFIFIFQSQVTRVTLKPFLQAQSAETIRHCLFKITICRAQKWPAKVLFILPNIHT